MVADPFVHGYSVSQKLLAVTLCFAAEVSADFEQDHYYAGYSNTNVIIHHDEDGMVVDEIRLPNSLAPDIRGLAFGPDRLLYVVSGLGPGLGFVVHAIDDTMTIQNSYSVPSGIVCCVINSGRVFFAGSNRFYVTARTGLYQFTIRETASATRLFAGSYQDAALLPSGNFLVALDDHLQEVTPAGVFVREIKTPGYGYSLFDLCALLYDSSNDTIYVARAATDDNILHIDSSTGKVLHHATFRNATDLLFNNSGDLVISSRTQLTGVFDKDLVKKSSFAGWPADSIAQARSSPGLSAASACALAVLATVFCLAGFRTLSQRIPARNS